MGKLHNRHPVGDVAVRALVYSIGQQRNSAAQSGGNARIFRTDAPSCRGGISLQIWHIRQLLRVQL